MHSHLRNGLIYFSICGGLMLTSFGSIAGAELLARQLPANEKDLCGGELDGRYTVLILAGFGLGVFSLPFGLGGTLYLGAYGVDRLKTSRSKTPIDPSLPAQDP